MTSSLQHCPRPTAYLTTNYIGFSGRLRVIEEIYNGVLATYGLGAKL